MIGVRMGGNGECLLIGIEGGKVFVIVFAIDSI